MKKLNKELWWAIGGILLIIIIIIFLNKGLGRIGKTEGQECSMDKDCRSGLHCVNIYCPPDAYCMMPPTCVKLRSTGVTYGVFGNPTGECPLGSFDRMVGDVMYCKFTYGE